MGLRKKFQRLTSKSFDLVKARTLIPINLVNVIPESTWVVIMLDQEDSEQV